MKTLSIKPLLTLAAVLSGGMMDAVWADYSSTVLSDSPAGYWRLGEMPVTYDDPITNSGTLGAAANGLGYSLTHAIPGALASSADTASDFTGAGAVASAGPRVVLGSASAFNFTGTASFTLEAWVKPTSLSGSARIISNGSSGQGYAFGFQGNNALRITGFGVADVSSDNAPVAFGLGQWIHVAVVRNGTSVIFYTNGVQYGAAKTLANVQTTANPLVLGRNASLTEPFNGAIDEACVYDKALEATAIAAHYTAGSTAGGDYFAAVQADSPIGYWRLNEPAKPASIPVANRGSLGVNADGSVIGSLNSVVGGITGPLMGDPDMAMRFNGLDGKIEVPYQPALNPAGAWTIECWARLEGWGNAHQSPLTSRNDSGTGQRGYIFYAAPVNNNPQWQFWHGIGSGWQSLAGPGVTTDTWSHLLGTYDPVTQTKTFYVDGQRVGVAANAIFYVNEAKPLRIGAGATDNAIGNFYWNGSVDEVAVYPGVLSPDRVIAHYAAAMGSAPAVVNPPVVAVSPPATQTVHSDQPLFLVAGFTGSVPMTFQWYRLSIDLTITNLLPATTEALEFSSTKTSDTGYYYCVASNALGTAESTLAFLEVQGAQPPSVTEDLPASLMAYPGATRTFEVVYGGTPPLAYQWSTNGVVIPEATNASLTLVGLPAAGNTLTCAVQVTNRYGVANSSVQVNIQAPKPNTYAAVMTTLNPLSWWRLGEDAGMIAYDSWGGRNGHYEASIPNSGPGALLDDDDGALSLLGSASRMVVSNSAVFNFTGTNAFTLVTWARPELFSGVQRLISNRSATPNGGYGFGFRNNNQVRLTAFGVVDVDASVASFDLSTWYHLAAVRKGNRMELYINGELRNSGTVANVNSTSNVVVRVAPLQLGGNPTGTEYFTGAVDESAVFDRPLTSNEIAQLYGARFGALVAPTITQEPAPNTLYEGGTAHFMVVATGSQPLSYQWRSNGIAILDATNSTYVVPAVNLAMSGSAYSVTVKNSAGTGTSVNALLTVLAGYGYQAAIAADEPVALWRLNEASGPTVFDSFGGHNGAAVNTVTFSQPGALANDADTAIKLDGVAGDLPHVQVLHSMDLNPPRFSVECWARVTGGAGAYRAAVSSRDYQAGYIIYAANNNTWQFWTRTAGVGWQGLAGPAVVEGEWTHLVATFDGINKTLYVNGAIAATEQNTNYSPNLLRPLRIGAGNNEDDPGAGSIYPFMGDLDEVAIYNYPLDAEKIAAHYGLGKYSTNTAPFMVQEPGSLLLAVGRSATLTLQAGGSPKLNYQWQKDGVDIPGATNSSFTLPSAYFTDAGVYRAVVSNDVGTTNSAAATLTVMPPASFCMLTNDLVLHLEFEGNYQDSSGRGHHAEARNTPGFATGRIGSQAFRFNTDSTNFIYNYATLASGFMTPTDFQFGATTDFSVAFWLKYSTSPGDPVFIGDANWDGGSKGWLISPTFGTDGLALWISDGTQSLNYNGPAGTIGGNVWHHVVATFQRAGNVNLYLDGTRVYQASMAAIGDINNSDLGYVLNIGQDGTGQYFPYITDGTVDDLGLWRRALSEYEAQSVYRVGRDAGLSFDETGPVTIYIQPTEDFIDVIWQAGTLMQSSEVQGTYTVVPDAVAPFYRTKATGSAMFFQVK